MKKIMFIHSCILAMYIGGFMLGLGIFVLIQKIFNIQLPTEILVFWLLSLMVISIVIRVKTYNKRFELLSKEEMGRRGIWIFFATGYAELLFILFTVFSIIGEYIK